MGSVNRQFSAQILCIRPLRILTLLFPLISPFFNHLPILNKFWCHLSCPETLPGCGDGVSRSWWAMHSACLLRSCCCSGCFGSQPLKVLSFNKALPNVIYKEPHTFKDKFQKLKISAGIKEAWFEYFFKICSNAFTRNPNYKARSVSRSFSWRLDATNFFKNLF